MTADKDYLSFLPVNINGEIMEKGKNSHLSKAETLNLEMKNKAKLVAKKKSKKDQQTKEALMKEKTIFDESSEDLEAEPGDSNKSNEASGDDTDPAKIGDRHHLREMKHQKKKLEG